MQQARCEGAQTTKIRLLLLLLFFDLDHTYEEFYGKGKKNTIIHIPKNSFWSPGMKLTREGKILHESRLIPWRDQGGGPFVSMRL